MNDLSKHEKSTLAVYALYKKIEKMHGGDLKTLEYIKHCKAPRHLKPGKKILLKMLRECIYIRQHGTET